VLNPAGTTPVLFAEGMPAIPGRRCDRRIYRRGLWRRDGGRKRLLPATMGERVEVRRLLAWFNDKFFEEVSSPLVTERIYKRFMREDNGGGAPATDVIRAAKTNVRYHLAYIGWLAQRREIIWRATGRPTRISPPRRIFRRSIIWATCHGARTTQQRRGTRGSNPARRSVRC